MNQVLTGAFVRVAVPVPGLDLLTYRLVDGQSAARGSRVIVPVGTRRVTGCVVHAAAPEPPSSVDVRDVEAVLDPQAFLPDAIVDLALWTAEYYAAGPGDVIAAALPPLAMLASERRASITDVGRERLAASPADRSPPMVVLRALAGGASFSIRELAAQTDGPVDVERTLRALVRQGAVRLQGTVRGRASAFRLARTAALSAAGRELALASDSRLADAGKRPLGAKQRAALQVLVGTGESLELVDLAARGIAPGTVHRLASRGLIVLGTSRRERDPWESGLMPPGAQGPGPTATATTVLPGAHGPGPTATATAVVGNRSDGSPLERRVLTAEQDAALNRLLPRVRTGGFHVALLHGVTGSGKTELYLRLAAAAVDERRGVLMLVPEIALTPAMAGAFRAAFGPRVAIQHSGLSDGERHDQWHRIRAGEIAVVVGTRSAVFTPLDRTGLIIVDEEHDPSYKQEEAPRYNGRDVAIVRGQQQQAVVLLGSATPSLESYRHAVDGRYELVMLERRVLDRPLAAVRVVNMREELASEGPDVVLSRTLVDALRTRLARGEQAMLLLNRRGFATAVFCRQCGATLDCPNCSVSLTIHHERRGARARCHYCNYTAAAPKACTACAAPYVEHIGVGTARVEAEVARLLPGARIARVDRDTVQRRGAIQAILRRVAAREVDVVVGTQMIAKGHDFPAVTLAGVISADVGLGLPDFRAAERTFQLLTQVAGRAGRGEAPGEAIVQTLFPEHYSIELACRQDYRAFFERELAFRRAMRYPPVVKLVNVIVRGATPGDAMRGAADLAMALRTHPERERYRVLGPAPAPLGRVRGAWRAQLLLKGSARPMRQAVQQVLAAHPSIHRRATVDVDPLSLM